MDVVRVVFLDTVGMLAVTIPPKYQQRRGTSRSRGGPVATVHGTHCACVRAAASVLTSGRRVAPDCIDYTLMDEELTGSEQYFCDSCNGKQDARKVLHLTQTPRLLVIHVVRPSPPTLCCALLLLFR